MQHRQAINRPHQTVHHGREGYFEYRPTNVAVAAPAPAPPQDEAASAGAGGLLSALTTPLFNLWAGSGDTTPAPATPVAAPAPAPPTSRQLQRRNDPRRTHSDSQALTVVSAEPPEPEATGLLSYLPALPKLPSLLPKRRPEAPPELCQEALDTVVRYLALHSEHAVNPLSCKLMNRCKSDAERLMLAMSPAAVSSLHAFLVVVKRAPETPIAFDPSMLIRYTRGDRKALETLVDALGNVLRGLAGVLEGGFTVPGGWVGGEEEL